MTLRRVLAALVVCGLATAGALWFAGRSADAGPSVPTITASHEKFIRKVVAEGNLRPVKATLLASPSSGRRGPKKIAWMAPDGSTVKQGDIVVTFDPTELQKQLEDGQGDLAAADARLAKERIGAQGAVHARDTASDLAKTEYEAATKFPSMDEDIYSRQEIIESELDEELSRARMDHADSTRTIEQRLARSKIGLIEVQKRKADIAIKQAKEGLTGLEIVAPHDGILVFKRNWRGELPRVGQQVWGGQPVAEIPILDEMEAEVFVLEIDGAGLKDGAKGTVIVEAQPGVEYAATIKRVAKLAEPRQSEVPVQYFAVALELEKTVPEVMKPGQRVRATLILEEIEAVVVPRNAVFERDNTTVVYKRVDGKFEPVKVELGAATAGRVVITSGVEPGDELALRDPTKLAATADDDEQTSGAATP